MDFFPFLLQKNANVHTLIPNNIKHYFVSLNFSFLFFSLYQLQMMYTRDKHLTYKSQKLSILVTYFFIRVVFKLNVQECIDALYVCDDDDDDKKNSRIHNAMNITSVGNSSWS